MSSYYSANQYDGAYRSQKLQNWCQTKHFKERPSAQEGHTTFIADDRGHLLPGVLKRGSAWPDFKGTWELPAHIPAPYINQTGRSVEGLNRLRSWGFDPQHTGKSQPHRGSTNTVILQDDGMQVNVDLQQNAAALPSAAAPAHDSRPDSGKGEPASNVSTHDVSKGAPSSSKHEQQQQ